MKRALLLAAAVLVTAPSTALAVYQCGDTKDDCQCGASNPYPCCDNGGNCTWYAWEAACCAWGVGLPGWGNANQWTGRAQANASYQVLSYPVVNAVSCKDTGSYGHVAFTIGINGTSTVTVKEQNCWGNYGMDVHTFQASYFTGGYIVRSGQVACKPGDTQSQSCGNCGTQSRGCDDHGAWGGWGACSDQGACTPGAEEAQACGDCGTQTRKCSTSCQWQDFGTCGGTTAPVPDAGTCDTKKPGVCSVGAPACIDGKASCVPQVEPSAELCDGLDNDCDGEVDGPGVCPTELSSAAGSPSSGGASASAGPLAAANAVTGSCAAVPFGPSTLAFALVLRSLLARRR